MHATNLPARSGRPAACGPHLAAPGARPLPRPAPGRARGGHAGAAPHHRLATAAALALAGLTAGGSAAAQDRPAAGTPAVATVVVTGNPLGSGALAQPAAVLSGEGLALRRAATLGDTVAGLPGVAATGFGPQASRPVIRGLDGERIRLLDNGGASADASSLSFDHAVALDPLVVERIEVLRGPAALLYGGNATGGVVNTLDNRIPRQALGAPSGRAELRAGGAAAERAASALLEGGAGGLNWHVDAARRLAEDLRTPRFTPVADGLAQPATRRVANSAGDSQAGALGLSWAGARGHLGAALDGYRNDYGVVVEPDVTIRMRRERLQLDGERRGLAGPISALAVQGSSTRYRHQEVEGDGAVGTTFRSRGQELRLQATQAEAALGGGRRWQGLLGLQLERLDFSALGEEAFVPSTRTRSQALFTLQTLALPGGAALSAGARAERVRVASDGDAADAAEPRFGAPAQRRFAPASASLGAVLPLPAAGWQASATLGHTERAPAYHELYANGPHLATAAWERGDPALGVERSRHLELGLQRQQADGLWRAALFATRFARYLALDATGATVDDGDGGSLPEVRVRGVPARLHGLELEARQRWRHGSWQLEGSAALDWLRGVNRASGEALPRLAPLRLQAGLEGRHGALRLGGQLRHAARQDHVPAHDVATPAATLLDLWAGWQQALPGGADALWTVKLTNVGDALAWNASALRTVRTLSPAGGRALALGLRLGF